MKNERCPDGPKKICPEQTCPVAPACLTISRAVHNKDGDRIRIQVRVQGEILDFDMRPEDFALAVTGLGEVPMTLDRWRGRRVAPTPPALRPALQWFAEQMEDRLAANDHKGGWEHCSLGLLAERLCDEVAELAEASSFQATAREAVDVANFALMIADVARKKAQP